MRLLKYAHVFFITTMIFSGSILAEEIVVESGDTDVTNAPEVQNAPAARSDLMQKAADGEVVMPRVRTFNKPNRMLLHQSVDNLKSGFSFLEQNKNKPGVITLKDGLQYKVLRNGTGAKPKEQDVVSCTYVGTLVDGTVFEESPAGKPANVKISSLLPGLKEALMLMAVGSKWQIYVPSELGFAGAGKPPKVGPSAVLIYDVDLRAIVTK